MLENRFLYWMDFIYSFFLKIGSNLQSVFLLYMRLTWGHQLLLAGMDKLDHIKDTAIFFTKLNIPYPLFHAYSVGWFETIGGLFFILGFASRVISIPVIIIMFTALTTAHIEPLEQFKFLTDPHTLVAQAPYPFLVTALLVFIFGPGRISLDALIKRWIEKQPKY